MTGKDTNAPHAHPQEAIPVRVAKESGFAGPGLDVPAEQSRPARDAVGEHDHPLNRPVSKENESLIGPQLGMGGTQTQTLSPVNASCVYTNPGFTGEPDEKFVPSAVDPAVTAAPQFVDRSDLLMRVRKGTTTND
jgi:hypothetical protein